MPGRSDQAWINAANQPAGAQPGGPGRSGRGTGSQPEQQANSPRSELGELAIRYAALKRKYKLQPWKAWRAHDALLDRAYQIIGKP